jgi:hypothetical protein
VEAIIDGIVKALSTALVVGNRYMATTPRNAFTRYGSSSG